MYLDSKDHAICYFQSIFKLLKCRNTVLSISGIIDIPFLKQWGKIKKVNYSIFKRVLKYSPTLTQNYIRKLDFAKLKLRLFISHCRYMRVAIN